MTLQDSIKNFGDSFRNTMDKVWGFFMKSVSLFVSTVFLIFSVGTMVGYLIATSNISPIVLLIPPVLGVFAFYYRTFTVFLFIVAILLLII